MYGYSIHIFISVYLSICFARKGSCILLQKNVCFCAVWIYVMDCWIMTSAFLFSFSLHCFSFPFCHCFLRKAAVSPFLFRWAHHSQKKDCKKEKQRWEFKKWTKTRIDMAQFLYMGGNLLTVQSMEIFFLSLATVFGNLEVWKVKKWNIFLKYTECPEKNCA